MLKDILVLDTSNQIKKIEKFFKSNNFKNYDLPTSFKSTDEGKSSRYCL